MITSEQKKNVLSQLTDEQKSNLAKLADYLAAMPGDYARTHFLMATFAACLPESVVETRNLRDFYEDYDTESLDLADFKKDTSGQSYTELYPNAFRDQPPNSQYVCGTCACAIGHGPAAGIKVVKGESWPSYCRRVFGLEQAYFGDWDVSDVWDHLFGPDNEDDPYAAAQRIRDFLK